MGQGGWPGLSRGLPLLRGGRRDGSGGGRRGDGIWGECNVRETTEEGWRQWEGTHKGGLPLPAVSTASRYVCPIARALTQSHMTAAAPASTLWLPVAPPSSAPSAAASQTGGAWSPLPQVALPRISSGAPGSGNARNSHGVMAGPEQPGEEDTGTYRYCNNGGAS